MYIKLSALAIAIVFLTGCGSIPQQPTYGRNSPTIEIVKESDFKRITRREPGSVRNHPYTTLSSSVKEAGDVMITVTFTYSPGYNRRSREPRLSHCKLHIKSPDSSLADVWRCGIETAGNTFMVSFRSPGGIKSFDLKALGGTYDGQWPIRYTNSYISYGYHPGGTRTLRYYYVGPDPFK